jgi:hypothetical protein
MNFTITYFAFADAKVHIIIENGELRIENFTFFMLFCVKVLKN